MTTKNDPSEPTDETDLQIRKYWEDTLSSPAQYCNNSSLLNIPNGVRIVFSETFSEQSPVWHRAAIVLSDVDAYHLWRQLGESAAVTRVQKFLEEAQSD